MNYQDPCRAVLTRSIVSLLSLSAIIPTALGADGLFLNESGGAWDISSNWLSDTIADGAGARADFSLVELTGDRRVTLGTARTVADLVFGDVTTTAGSAGGWTLGNLPGGTAALTLSGPLIPAITVNPLATGKMVDIDTVLAGTEGFSKEGRGTLQLSRANTLSGTINVNNGTLRLADSAAINNVTEITVNAHPELGVGGAVIFQLNEGVTAGQGKVLTMFSGASRTALHGGVGSHWQGDVVLAGSLHNAIYANSNDGAFTISGDVSGGAGSVFLLRGIGLGIVTGNIDVPIPLTKTERGNWTITTTGNSWTSTDILDGQITVGIDNALPVANVVLGQASGTNGRLELNGFDQEVAGISTNAASTGTNHIIRNSSTTSASTLTFTTLGTEVLKNTQFQGVGALTLDKNGAGRLEIQDGRVDNSAFNVNDGTLAFTGDTARSVAANVTGLAAATIERAGLGTTNFNGSFNNAGATVIASGRMNFSTGNSASITVADGATLGAGLKGGSFTAGAITFDGSSIFAPLLGQSSAPALVNVTNLSTSGAGTPVTPEGADIEVGTYKLLQYGAGGTPNLVLGAPGTYPHMTATLEHDTVARRFDLDVTAVDSLIWSGAIDGAWNVNATANFKLASNPATSAPFFQSDSVLFDDTGAANPIITAAGQIRVGDLTFDNSAAVNYTINGALAGPGGITKKNTGIVTLSDASGLEGPIDVSGGTLVLGGANGVHGPVTVTAGTLELGHADAISSGAPVKVAAGGTLDVAGFVPGARIPELRISGAGADGKGAMINSGSNIPNNTHASTIILEGDTTWGGSGRLDINGARFEGGNFTLTKIGAQQTWWLPAPGSTLGPVVVEGGTFGIFALDGVNTNSSIRAKAEGTIGLSGAYAITRQMILESGAIVASGGTPTIGGEVNLLTPDSAGAPQQRIGASGSNVLEITGSISGEGGLEKHNTGTLTLSGANTYSGATLISGGVLEVNGSIAGTLVSVDPGTTLTGAGTISTSLDIDGMLAPGAGFGTLTATGAADFNDGSTFSLDIGVGVASDSLVAGGVTLDGAVNLAINLAATPVPGASFRIIDNTGLGAIGGTSGFFTWAGPEGLLTEGEQFLISGIEFSISYQGGTGNDVVLTAVPEPGSLITLLGGSASLMGLQRFRRPRAR
ncbi:MAG: beta strand repeat-containing protein [Chthoniobacteraceae bacterium]